MVCVLNEPYTNRHQTYVIGVCLKVKWVVLTKKNPVRNYLNATDFCHQKELQKGIKFIKDNNYFVWFKYCKELINSIMIFLFVQHISHLIIQIVIFLLVLMFFKILINLAIKVNYLSVVTLIREQSLTRLH